MKSKYLIFGLLILLIACKKNEKISFDSLFKTNKDSLVNKDEKFDKNDFEDRAEELIYIREYLKYKLPMIMIKNNLDLVKKAQYELIANGENPNLTDAAKRTIAFDNRYSSYMSLITSENMSFKDVKNQLESKGEIDFNISNGIKINYKDYYQQENERKTNESITDKTIDEPTDILENSSKSNYDVSGKGNGSGSNSGYSLERRKAINKPQPEYNCNEEGTVVVEIVVDKKGNVLEAKTGLKGTTNNSKCLLDACKEAASKTKWEVDENAPEKQVGNISYNFRMN
jgi:hypothetical protein